MTMIAYKGYMCEIVYQLFAQLFVLATFAKCNLIDTNQ